MREPEEDARERDRNRAGEHGESRPGRKSGEAHAVVLQQTDYTQTAMLIVLIILGVIVLYSALRLAWIFSGRGELEAGGSQGRQLFSGIKLRRRKRT